MNSNKSIIVATRLPTVFGFYWLKKGYYLYILIRSVGTYYEQSRLVEICDTLQIEYTQYVSRWG